MKKTIEREVDELVESYFNPRRIGMAHVGEPDRLRSILLATYDIGVARGVRRGLSVAADHIEESEQHFRESNFRIADLIRCKFNLWRRVKPRRYRAENPKRDETA